jgi:hypothetical protein
MDQAAVLPDPLDESTAASSTLASADDLLAQLAGEEIDRLLAESEAETASLSLRRRTQDVANKSASEQQPVDAPPAAAPAPAPVEEPPEVNLDALAKEVEASGEVGGAGTPTAEPSAAEVVQPLPAPAPTVETLPPTEAATPPASAPVAIPAPPTPAAPSAPAPVAAPAAPPPAETATLNDVLVASTLPAEAIDAMDAGDSLPLYLKPLEWLNAPLDALPEGWRDALGKVAIITLVNAIAVLLYVALFRN